MIAGGTASPMCLVTAKFLEDVLASDHCLPSREDLPSNAAFDGSINDRVLVVALSYCWCKKEHPDPEKLVLQDVVQFLRYLGGQLPCEIVVFWDWASLYQRRETPDRINSFKTGLSMVNMLYGHASVMVLLCTRAHRNLQYLESGWPFFEWCVSQLLKEPWLTIDLPAALRFIESTEGSIAWNRQLCFLVDACRTQTRRIAISPRFFDAELEGKTVTNGSDKEILRKKYKETFQHLVSSARAMKLQAVSLATAREWVDLMSSTVPLCHTLQHLDLSSNERLQTSLTAVGRLHNLQSLNLRLCKGVAGSLSPLRNATMLEDLDLSGCLALTGGVKPLARLTRLKRLALQRTGVRGPAAPLMGLNLESINIEHTNLEGSVPNCQHVEFNLILEASSLGMAESLRALLLQEGRSRARAVDVLVAVHADVNRTNSDGATPLYSAAERGHVDVAGLLIEHRAEVNRAQSRGATPLFIASQKGHVDLACSLARARAELDTGTEDGMTPLYIASQNGHCEVVHMLTRQNADVDAGNHSGATPLYISSQLGHPLVVRVLLGGRAHVDRTERDAGTSPLFVAAQNGHCDVADALLEYHADVNQSGMSGATPLFIASHNGHCLMARLLLEKRADANVREEDACTSLFIASQVGHFDVSTVLIEHRADVNAAEKRGATPLFIASCGGHLEVVRLLVEQRADVLTAAQGGVTALFMAAQRGHFEVVRVLADAGASSEIER